jgi:PTH1 family peptidyl-tRNA hydrolase
MSRHLIVIGLGNPGAEYGFTRHNVGFMAVDKIAASLGLRFSNKKLYSISKATYLNDENTNTHLILVKPLTYMNNSGEAVKAVIEKYNVIPSEILIICDDFALPLGRIRLRRKGSSGGHLGLESVITSLGTTDFPRLRIGIGPLPEGTSAVDFVLGEFTKDELIIIGKVLNITCELVGDYAKCGIEKAMSKYNSIAINS